MEMPNVSSFLKIGYASFVLCGIPLTFKITRASSWVWLVISLFCLVSRLSISVVSTFMLLTDEISSMSKENNKGEVVYYTRTWVLFYWEVLLTSLIMFRNRRELKIMFEMMQHVEDTVNRNRSGQDNAVLMWKTLVISINLVGAGLSAMDNTSNILHTVQADSNRTEFASAILYAYPAYLLTWVVCYNSIVVWTTELQLNRNIIKRIYADKYVNPLSSALPLADANKSSLYILYDPKCKPKPRQHWIGNGKLLRTLTAMKMFNEFTNRKLSTPLTIMVIVNAFFMPLVFTSCYRQSNSFVTSSFFGPPALYNVFWISTIFILPVFIKEWSKSVRKNFVLEAKKDVYKVSDLKTKKMLNKFVASAGDKYPDSVWKLLCFDFAMISNIFDVTILLGTAFVLP